MLCVNSSRPADVGLVHAGFSLVVQFAQALTIRERGVARDFKRDRMIEGEPASREFNRATMPVMIDVLANAACSLER